jgi:hypothetical protein
LRQQGRLLGAYWGYDYEMASPGAEESFVLDRIARMVKPRDYEIELGIGPEGHVTSAEFRGRGLTHKKRDRLERLLEGMHFNDERFFDHRFELKLKARELARRNPPNFYIPSATEEAPQPLRDMDD